MFWVGEMAQQLGALVALPETQVRVLGSAGQPTTFCNSSSRRSSANSGIHGTVCLWCIDMHADKYSHTRN